MLTRLFSLLQASFQKLCWLWLFKTTLLGDCLSSGWNRASKFIRITWENFHVLQNELKKRFYSDIKFCSLVFLEVLAFFIVFKGAQYSISLKQSIKFPTKLPANLISSINHNLSNNYPYKFLQKLKIKFEATVIALSCCWFKACLRWLQATMSWTSICSHCASNTNLPNLSGKNKVSIDINVGWTINFNYD